jgi:threonine/homoserine/homoserine lactone efflux protein
VHLFGITDLWLFVFSGLLLNIAPGPDTLYILGRTAGQGWRGGALAALGIGTGCLVHVCAAALGLSAILAASATAFVLVKWAGAAYLVYVGFSLLRERGTFQDTRALADANPRTVFMQGFLCNVLNPKVALFFLAFLPQFIDPAAPHKALSFLFLGLLFDFNGTLWNLFLAWSAARVAGWLTRSRVVLRWLNRGIGALLMYLGVKLAVSR